MEQKSTPVPSYLRWTLVLGIVAAMIVTTLIRYRYVYTTDKRLREVAPGKLYRSGRMTAQGLEKAIKDHNIRTVINLMEEEPDPELTRHYFGGGTEKESELCKRLGADFVFLRVDLTSRKRAYDSEPQAIQRFVEIMKDPKNHPVLLHCRAGLHRAGVMTAVYRLEFDKWSPTTAWKELRNYGFGETRCYADNDYITQYIFAYEHRKRQ